MKKMKILLMLTMLFTMFYACDTDSNELEDSLDVKSVFTMGETYNNNLQRGKGGLDPNCGVLGALCAEPNQSLTYTYSSPDPNPTITWTVNSGDITIASGQGTYTVTLTFGSNFSGGNISVIGVGPSNCYVERNILLCEEPACTTYALGILDEYIDGTQSGANFVYLHAGGNFPSGTTYEWTITRQDGSIQYYGASTSNPRLVSASISNRITEATVTATYGDCVRTVNKVFDCAIPNSDANGNLFPECQ